MYGSVDESTQDGDDNNSKPPLKKSCLKGSDKRDNVEECTNGGGTPSLSVNINRGNRKQEQRRVKKVENKQSLIDAVTRRLKRNEPSVSEQPSMWIERSTSVPVGAEDSRTNQLSEDEYANEVISSIRRPLGRRSAPLFSRRAFGTTTFWNDGQTSINRYLKQGEPRVIEGGSQSRTDRRFARQRSKQKKRHGKYRTFEDIDERDFESSRACSEQEADASRTDEICERDRTQSLGGENSRVLMLPPMASDAREYFSDYDGSTSFFVPHDVITKTSSYHEGNSRRYQSSHNEELLPEAKTNKVLEDSKAQKRSVTHGGFKNLRSLGALPEVSCYTTDETRNGLKDIPVIPCQADTAILKRKDIGDNVDEESSSSDDSEDTPLLEDKKTLYQKTEVYKRRWYLLFLFSFFSIVWNAVWSTWGPIAQSAKTVFGWSDGNIAMFTWLGNAPFLVTMFPIAYLMDVKGMRISMILCCGLTFVGAGLRCIPADVEMATWLIYAGQLLNGIAGTVPMAAPGLLSGLWFPPNQRATATAISTVCGYLGACVSYVIGPLLVKEPDLPDAVVNNTNPNFLNQVLNTVNTTNATDITAQKNGIMNILYYECGAAGLIFLLVLIYFPSKPPRPPSVSASIPREKYLNGIKMLVKNKYFWVVAIAFSVPMGVYEVWQVVLDVNLNPRVSQKTAGWMDFFSTLGGCAAGLLVSRFADVFTRQMKLCLLIFYCLAALGALWLTLVVADFLPFDTVSVYAAIVIVGVFLDGGAPLFFEMVIEVSYPVGEGVTSGFLQMITAAAGMVFLSLLQIESIGKEWMNWCFFGCILGAIPLLYFIDVGYVRADIDDMEIDVSEDDESVTNIMGSDEADKRSLLDNSNV